MSRLSTAIIQFVNEIEPKSLPYFRGAVIASLEKKDILFHNHDDDNLRYAYPLIQYKLIHNKASVMGIGKGVDAISQLLSARDYNYQIGNENMEMLIESVKAYDNEIVQTGDNTHRYHLRNWLPLNSINYVQYQKYDSLVERIQILERVLIGNILSFLKGNDIHLEEQIFLHITEIKGQSAVIYKKMQLMAFDIDFKANILLPQYVGLGKNASIGCGVLTIIKTT